MTIEELMLDQEIRKLEHLDNAWLAFQSEARASKQRGGLRSALASAFVNVGARLDAGAVERAATVARPATRQEA